MPSRIHFLNTDNSDCIILESNGLFAMVDAGEDTEYPPDKPHLNLKGFEKEVIQYINKHCSDSKGNITFEFIVGTHAHSDHIGGFDTVIEQPNVFIKKAYLKPYYEDGINRFERERWDNLEVYTQMVNALKDKSIPVIQEFEGVKECLGEFNITFYNGNYVRMNKKTGENRNSVLTLIEKDKLRALLAADLDYLYGGERVYSKIIGKINLLKVGHHGYLSSTTKGWLKKLMPEIAVICNSEKRVNKVTRYKLINISKSRIYYTYNSNGIIADFKDRIEIITDIM